MHGHGMRPREPVGETPIEIRRYTCPVCGVAVQVLPSFVARNLWRTWPVVEAVCVAAPERRLTTTVAPRTVARWWARLCLTVAYLLQVLSAVRLAALRGSSRISASARRGETRSSPTFRRRGASGPAPRWRTCSVAYDRGCA